MTDTVEVADVAVIGLGYIGLPTAAVLARAGLDVVGVDRIRERVEAVNRGELPFLEEGLATVLAELVTNAVEHGLDGRDGRVTVKACRDEDRLEVHVMDDGAGLAPDTLMTGLGTRIVTTLVRGELRGSIA